MRPRHPEIHRTQRTGWLRAAVLGANDGIVSTASLLIGVAAAHLPLAQILVTGVAGMVAGAMSMAAGEYVSVGSQRDSERADIARERNELATDIAHEHAELAAIYVQRGLDDHLAEQVAAQLMAKDALGAHVRDELGLSESTRAQPVQASIASASSFAAGAALPLITALLVPANRLEGALAGSTLLFLAILGAIAAYSGGAPVLAGVLRVALWGAMAMTVTALIGSLFHLQT